MTLEVLDRLDGLVLECVFWNGLVNAAGSPGDDKGSLSISGESTVTADIALFACISTISSEIDGIPSTSNLDEKLDARLDVWLPGL